VVAFGYFLSARVATLAINPSRKEFQYNDGGLRQEGDRRFETLDSLEGLQSLEDCSDEVVDRVISGCCRYFEVKPYWRWFRPLQRFILPAVNASYVLGTACHLDLVQWATDPTWGGLTGAVREELLREDLPFLVNQLARHHVGLLLINGRTAVEQFELASNVHLDEVEPLRWSWRSTAFFVGTYHGARVIGWSTNLQGQRGLTNVVRDAIGRRVGELAGVGRVA
jgi:hypothetical protein